MALALPKVAVPGPLVCVHSVVTAAGGLGRPSSVTVASRLASARWAERSSGRREEVAVKPVEIGRIRVENVVEWYGPTRPTWVLPDAAPEAVERHRDWLAPHFMDARGRFLMSIHCFIVRAPGLTVLVDTCVGNDKPRQNPGWHMLQTDFLDRLAAAGCPPESVDLVLCTHLHVDHVGWNTRLDNGRWVPTFPRARYLFARTEWEHWSKRRRRRVRADHRRQRAAHRGGRPRRPRRGQSPDQRGAEPRADAGPHPRPREPVHPVPGPRGRRHRRPHAPSRSSAASPSGAAISTTTPRWRARRGAPSAPATPTATSPSWAPISPRPPPGAS